VHGIETSRRRAQALIADAHTALEPFGERALPLRALGTFIIERKA
jgi:geranylgeranyl diphosphate synthase type II